MDTIPTLLGFALLYLLIVLILFLLLREVNCWYWKINERIVLQRETNRLLSRILETSQTAQTVEKLDASITASKQKISLNEMYRRKRENGDAE